MDEPARRESKGGIGESLKGVVGTAIYVGLIALGAYADRESGSGSAYTATAAYIGMIPSVALGMFIDGKFGKAN